MTKPHIAVDFDGVIHKYSKGWNDGTIYDVPVDGAKEALERLSKKYNVIIFTTRLNPELCGDKLPQKKKGLAAWLSRYGFEKNIHYTDLTGAKPKAMIYIDDRGLRFENWDKALSDVEKLL